MALARGWLVRTKEGAEFSFHQADERDRADKSAALIGGTVEAHTPIESTYWEGTGPNYDH